MKKINLSTIAEKVEKGERLTKDDALTLMNSNDLISIGQMANKVREKIWQLRLFQREPSYKPDEHLRIALQVLRFQPGQIGCGCICDDSR